MLQAKIISDTQNVKNTLSLYGIEERHLTEIGLRGYAARNNATENDPPSTAGNNAYSAIVRAIREIFLPRGWEKLNKHNLCFTINPETKIAIVVSSGNQYVGIIDNCDPETKNRKGEQTEIYIRDNLNNLDIFDSENELQQKVNFQKDIFPKFKTFIFLYCYDLDKGEMRLELSLPRQMDNKGKVNRWLERIILEPTSLNAEPTFLRKETELSNDFQHIDIPIKRRQQ